MYEIFSLSNGKENTGDFLTEVKRIFRYAADMTSIQNVLNNYK